MAMPKARKKPNLKPLKTLRIYCEGEKTEPIYINGYIKLLDSQERKSVVSVEPTRKNTPVQLVGEAVAAKRSKNALPNDEYWVVYDREALSKYSDKLHAEAMRSAERIGVSVALCNVCFEYWLLLHFVDTNAPYTSCRELQSNSGLNSRVFELTGTNHDKASTFLFDLIKGDIPKARKRGEKLNRDGVAVAAIGKEKPFHINPYVGMVELLDAIDAFE